APQVGRLARLAARAPAQTGEGRDGRGPVLHVALLPGDDVRGGEVRDPSVRRCGARTGRGRRGRGGRGRGGCGGHACTSGAVGASSVSGGPAGSGPDGPVSAARGPGSRVAAGSGPFPLPSWSVPLPVVRPVPAAGAPEVLVSRPRFPP